jgi:non-ribosomal peptide synthase protein (TIGR01720 family)
MRAVPQPEISFTYFGHVPRRLPAGNERPADRPAEPDTGPARAAEGLRLHKIEIAARLGEDGLLRTDFGYSTNLFRPETVRQLADRFLGELAAIARLAAPGAAGGTARDFARSGLSEGDLARLRSRLGPGDVGARV